MPIAQRRFRGLLAAVLALACTAAPACNDSPHRPVRRYRCRLRGQHRGRSGLTGDNDYVSACRSHRSRDHPAGRSGEPIGSALPGSTAPSLHETRTSSSCFSAATICCRACWCSSASPTHLHRPADSGRLAVISSAVSGAIDPFEAPWQASLTLTFCGFPRPGSSRSVSLSDHPPTIKSLLR